MATLVAIFFFGADQIIKLGLNIILGIGTWINTISALNADKSN
jgi:hypothetical protein